MDMYGYHFVNDMLQASTKHKHVRLLEDQDKVPIPTDGTVRVPIWDVLIVAVEEAPGTTMPSTIGGANRKNDSMAVPMMCLLSRWEIFVVISLVLERETVSEQPRSKTLSSWSNERGDTHYDVLVPEHADANQKNILRIESSGGWVRFFSIVVCWWFAMTWWLACS